MTERDLGPQQDETGLVPGETYSISGHDLPTGPVGVRYDGPDDEGTPSFTAVEGEEDDTSAIDEEKVVELLRTS